MAHKKGRLTILFICLFITVQVLIFNSLVQKFLASSASGSKEEPHQATIVKVPTRADTNGDTTCPLHDIDILYPIPDGVEEDQRWRYSSKGLYWSKCDILYEKFKKWNKTITFPPKSVDDKIERVCKKLRGSGRGKLCDIFRNCFPNTFKTTIQMLHDGTSYVITGDIPLMWLRDSAAQVHHYLPLASSDPYVQIVIEGVIRRDVKWIQLDPYGSSFRLFLDFDHKHKTKLTDWDYQCGRTIHVAQHDWEPDSLCYFISLGYEYWKQTGINELFDKEWVKAIKRIVETFDIETHHNERSKYKYPTLARNGIGTNTCDVGLLWCGMRPSDDSCTYHFLIPTNIFAVVSLQRISEMVNALHPDEKDLINLADKLSIQIDDAIHKYAVSEKDGKMIYAYEVDGCGGKLHMDDANVPSLLSIPYLGYASSHDPQQTIYQNTRSWILSNKNPWFFSGRYASGIGSPHTGRAKVWHLAIIMQGITSDNHEERMKALNMLEDTDGGKLFMHESFSPDRPQSYTRYWFGWANSLFSEFILRHLDEIEPRKI